MRNGALWVGLLRGGCLEYLGVRKLILIALFYSHILPNPLTAERTSWILAAVDLIPSYINHTKEFWCRPCLIVKTDTTVVLLGFAGSSH